MKKSSLLFLWLSLSYSLIDAQYCIPTYSNGPSFGIFLDGVVLEDIQHINTGGDGTPAYKDYTQDYSTTLTIGQPYHLQATTGPNYTSSIGVWIDFNQDEDFEDEGEFVGEARQIRGGSTVDIPLQMTVDAIPGITRMRIVQVYANPALTPCGNYNYGETEDYGLILSNPTSDDVGLQAILAPQSGCGLGITEAIEVVVSNFGTDPQQEVLLSYSLNGDSPITETAALNLPEIGAIDTFQFSAPVDLSIFTTYELKVWTTLSGDTIPFNDTLSTNIENELLVNQFPYREDFEQDAGGWEVGGTNASWELGTPNMDVIQGAASGTQAWSTGGVSGTGYNRNEHSYLTSPCLDFSDLQLPVIEISLWWESETNRDGAQLQASIDGGETWLIIGNINEGENWYNTNNISALPFGERQGWGGHGSTGSGEWLGAKYLLTDLAGEANVKIRFRFASTGFTEYDGFALDNLQLYELPNRDISITTLASPMMPFDAGNNDVAVVIKNNGQNPITSFKVHWEVNGNTQAPFDWQGNLLPNDSETVQIGTFDFAEASVNTIKTWTSDPNGMVDENNLNDTLLAEGLFTTLEGVYTLGGDQDDFSSFNHAIEVLSNIGIADSVWVLVEDGTYEEQVLIPAIPGASLENPVIFRSKSQDTEAVTLQYASTSSQQNYTLKLDNASYIHFQDIHIKSLATTYPTAISLINDSHHNKFSDNQITGISIGNTQPQYSTIYMQASNQGAPLNNTFYNNTISNGSFGMYYQGYTTFSRPRNAGLNIEENHIYGSNVALVYATKIDSIKISGNHLELRAGSKGIHLKECNAGVEISLNVIDGSNVGQGVYYEGGNSRSSPGLIANNSIHIGSIGEGHGIFISGTYGLRLIHNSIHISSSHPSSTGIKTGSSIEFSTFNNIFANSGGGPSVYYTYNAPNESDYNCYYSNGTQLIVQGEEYRRLQDWQNRRGLDLHALAVNPLFATDADLHPEEVLLNGSGDPTKRFPLDLDGNERDSLIVDIGAYEFTPEQSATPKIVEINAPQTPFLQNSRQIFSAEIRNYGQETLDSLWIRWAVDDVIKGNFLWTGNLATGESETIELGAHRFVNRHPHQIKLWINQEAFLPDTLIFADYAELESITSALAGHYSIGGNNADFSTIGDASKALAEIGVADSVWFHINPGTYHEQVEMLDITYISYEKPVYFWGNEADSTDVIWKYNSRSRDRNYTLKLKDVKNLHFAYLTLQSEGNTYGTVVLLKENATEISFSHIHFKDTRVIGNGSTFEHRLVNFQPENNVRFYTLYYLFEHNYFENGGTALYFRASDTYIAEGHIRIANNQFVGQNAWGISIYEAIDVEVSNNDFESLGFFRSGGYSAIYLEETEGLTHINHNKINISDGGTGIFAYGDSMKIWNNQISIGGTKTSKGILAKFNEGYIYHNSVNIFNTSPLSIAFLIQEYVTNNIKVWNNIFANTGGGMIYSMEVNGSNGYYQTWDIDNNNCYATGDYFAEVYPRHSGKTKIIDLNHWQRITNEDHNSLTLNPYFSSEIDLHTRQIGFHDTGKLVSEVLDDIDGEQRNDGKPDMGADEFVPQLAVEAELVSLLKPDFPFATGAQTLSVSMVNNGANVLSDATFYWRINDLLQDSLAYGGALAPAAIDTVELGTAHFDLGTPYQIEVWIVADQDTFNTNDTIKTPAISPALAGTYLIGNSNNADFSNFSEAANALSIGGISDSVLFLIEDGTYDEQVHIPYIRGASTDKNIHFRALSGDSSAVILRYASTTSQANYTLHLDSVQHIRFSHMTIEASGAQYANAVFIEKGTNYVVFEHNQFIASDTTNINMSNGILLYAYNYDENVYGYHILNNYFYQGKIGLLLKGRGASDYVNQPIISGNTFVDQYEKGIQLEHNHTPFVAENIITTSNNFTRYEGISITFTKGDIKILANKITGSVGNYGIYLYANSYSQNQRGLIANNFIQIGGTDQAHGISINNSRYFRVYHNTINVTSTDANQGRALYFNSAFTDIKNNILANTGGGYAIYAQSVYSSSGIQSQYNDLYTSGTTLAYWSGNRQDLAAWKSFTNLDTRSWSVDPGFSSPTDGHISHPSLNQSATALEDVPLDFDGQVRSSTAVDIGADEFFIGNRDLAFLSVTSPDTLFQEGEQPVEIVMANYAENVLTRVPILWSVNDVRQSVLFYTDSIESGKTDTIRIGSFDFQAGEKYKIRIWTDNDGDDFWDNNEVIRDSIYPALVGVYTIGAGNADFSNLQKAIDALKYGGVVDSVILNIKSGIYTTNVKLPHIPNASPERQIIIQSENQTANSVTLLASSTNSILHLENAAHYKIRHLTFRGGSARLIYIFQKNRYNSFEHNVFRSTNARGAVVRLEYYPNSQGEPFATHHSFVDNQIIGGKIGLNIIGYSSRIGKGIEIIRNIFENQVESAIRLSFQDAPIVHDNQFTFNDVDFRYIYLYECTGPFQLTNNIINIQGSGSIYLGNCKADKEKPALIANNLMFRIGGDSENTPGFLVYNCHNVNVFHNTFQAFIRLQASEDFAFLNNIFFNVGEGLVMSADNPHTFSISDHNVFYNKEHPAFSFSEKLLTDFTAWQSVTGFDEHSHFLNPLFDFSGTPAIRETKLNNAGISLAEVQTDFYGETRHQATPDIGAIEFMPIRLDARPNSLITPTKVFAAGEQPVKVIVQNNGDAQLESLSISWKVNGQAQPSIVWTGNLDSGDTTMVDLGMYDFQPFSPYEIAVQTAQPNQAIDNYPINDLFTSDTLYTGLAGTYTIGGVEPDFETIEAAVEALKKGGIYGATTFLLRDGIYEEQILIPEIAGSSAENIIHFTSESTDSTAVIWQYSDGSPIEYVLQLRGVDHIRISYIHFKSTSEHVYRLIEFRDSVQNGIIDHNLFGNLDNHPTAIQVGIQQNSWYMDNVQIRENKFYHMDNGISLRSGQDIFIKQNEFEECSYRGINISGVSSLEITQNLIETDTSRRAIGIYLDNCENGLRVEGNQVIIPGIYQGMEISYQDLTTSPALIANNFISAEAVGLEVKGDNIKIFHNNIRVESDASEATAVYVQGHHIGIWNNILANFGGGNALQGGNKDILAFANYNNYFSTGEYAVKMRVINSSALREIELEDWQFITGFDVHTLAVDPEFISHTDLHTSLPLFDRGGTPILEIESDIDGESRDPHRPDIGADEFIGPFEDLALTAILIDTTNCGLSENEQIQIQLTNLGTLLLSEFTLGYTINGEGHFVENVVGQNIEVGETSIFTFLQTADFSLNDEYNLAVYVVEAGDQTNYQNDTLRLTISNYAYITSEITNLQPTDGVINLSRPIQFSWDEVAGAISYDIHLWLANDTSNIKIIADLDTTYYSYIDDIIARANYEWRVIAHGYCNEVESRINEFTTSITPIRNPDDIVILREPDDREERKAPLMPQIYPNPGKGIFHLNFQQKLENLSLEVFTLQGQKVYEHIFEEESNRFKLNLGELPEGIYYIYLSNNQQNIREKIQIIR